jgi:alanine dehydrogenase
MNRSKLVVDALEQCAEIGELHHALRASVLTRSDVVAELAEIVAGTASADFDADDVVVFDSTGSAIQDVAAAGIIYERAAARDIGVSMAFA